MDYDTALAQLHSLQRFGVKPGLTRVRELLRRLGDPQLAPYPRYIHIAGTNGKGSCGAMLQSMLGAAGQRAGFFSSPHLLHHCERYRIGGRPLSEAEFARLFAPVWQAIAAMTAEGRESPTEFEAVTALALLAFRQAEADWAVMECGLGGLYDSTNVIRAELALITNVALDHLDVLGPTLEDIAVQKAGIVKPGQTVVTAAAGSPLTIIAEQAARCGDPLLVCGRDFTVRIADDSQAGLLLDVSTAGQDYHGLRLPLLGRHQAVNAACAVQTAELAGLDEEAIRAGLAAVSWPCRLELVSRDPAVLIDGAHNSDGMAALAAALKRYWPGRRICGVVGMLDDKQREEALSRLLPCLTQVIVTRPGLPARSAGWARVGEIARSHGLRPLLIENSRAALAAAEETDCDLILICGSLYLAADLRGLFPLNDFLMKGEAHESAD
ncbi:MAG: bifunctional folylpolyglutamate synthase/dihydrofolate synthase [Firmicutes bacterium]|nr:bifunctional folylpolyglutamate synthase/dihydrofolate synthase [Bacillota bacterium]